MARYLGRAAATAVALSAFSACGASPPPSILWVSIDTLRADRLGAYGYARPTSPHLDALARRSVVFDGAFVQEPQTLTSHISMMASLYPDEHGAAMRPLEESAVTLAEVSREHGYATQAFTGGGYAGPGFGLGQGFAGFEHAPGLERKLASIEAWLAQHRSRPFFLFVHGYEVHSHGVGPFYRAPPPHRGRFSGGIRAPLRECGERNECYAQRFEEGLLVEADRRLISAHYDEGVAYADQLMGRLLAFVDGLEIDERLIVLVTSDHGEGLLDHDHWSHAELYDEVVRVPLLLKLPGDRLAGTRIPWLVEMIDAAPTLLGLAGLPIPQGFRGVDLSTQLTDAHGPREVVHAWRAKGPPSIMARMVRSDRWKLIDYLERSELFDLHADPLEKQNVAAAHPEQVKELRRLMRGPVPRGQGAPEQAFDPQTEAELRALGYVE